MTPQDALDHVLAAAKATHGVPYWATQEVESIRDDLEFAIWFSPGAIIDSFDTADDDDPAAKFIRNADEKTLRDIAYECLGSDTLWSTFHNLIEASVEDRIER